MGYIEVELRTERGSEERMSEERMISAEECKAAIERQGKFGKLFVEYRGCPRGHIGHSFGITLEDEALLMPAITDVDGNEWIPVQKDVLLEILDRCKASGGAELRENAERAPGGIRA